MRETAAAGKTGEGKPSLVSHTYIHTHTTVDSKPAGRRERAEGAVGEEKSTSPERS